MCQSKKRFSARALCLQLSSSACMALWSLCAECAVCFLQVTLDRVAADLSRAQLTSEVSFRYTSLIIRLRAAASLARTSATKNVVSARFLCNPTLLVLSGLTIRTDRTHGYGTDVCDSTREESSSAAGYPNLPLSNCSPLSARVAAH